MSRHLVDRADIDRLVVALNDARATSRLEEARRYGRLILDQLFGGDAELVRRRGPRFLGFRRLAEHPDLEVPAKHLWLAVRVELQYHELAADVRDNLGWYHHLALLPVTAPELRVDLARRAADGRWSYRALEVAVATVRAPRRAGGRPARPVLMRTLERLHRSLPEDIDVSGLSERHRAELGRLAGLVTARIERLRERLCVLVP